MPTRRALDERTQHKDDNDKHSNRNDDVDVKK